MTADKSNTVLLCTFRLDDLLLGIDVRDVQEILREAVITPIPGSSSAIDGLINLRGQIAATLDVRQRLGVEKAPEGSVPSHVVVKSGGEQLSLLVDSIGEVLEVGADLYELPPVTMPVELADLMVGTYKLEGELLLVLDVARVVANPPDEEQEAA